jgi:2-C-methyl-D-erythritol 4-phosphate cytidylyltransferase
MSSGAAASVTAVIAAAGSGERLGAGGPKAFVPLSGRPMVEWSIEAFREAGVAAIVVTVPPDHGYEPATVEPHGPDAAQAPLSVRVLAGGETRSASVSNALEAVQTDLVAIHDAARPLVTPELIEGVIAALAADPDAAGAIAAAPVTDTIKRAAEVPSADAAREETSPTFTVPFEQNVGLVVGETLDRGRLWAAQTPQVFRVEVLRAALAGDPGAVAAATDEAMLVEAAGGRVLIHPSPAENLKVTTPLDLRLVEQLLAQRASS